MTLATESLSFGYPGKTIGRDVTLAVAPGEALALLGPNGGGKTTLLKTMLGLLKPHGGSVSLDGMPLAALSVGKRARLIGYVPQAHAGVFAFSVRDVVLMGRTAYQSVFTKPTTVDRTIADIEIERLGVGHLADQPYTMISGGERQLVLIARALAQQPRYVVLDEPTASLDFGNQGKVMRQISELTAKGLGVLFTTHDPNQALRHADRVVMLGNGKVLADGPSRTVLTPESLQMLYGAPTIYIKAHDGSQVAYLPG